MTTTTVVSAPAAWRWLHEPRFDLTFIVGLPLVAIASALLVVYQPSLFLPVLAFDLWFLGYHHVIATYTRLCFDKTSFVQSRALLFVLFPVVAVATLALAVFVGLWAVISTYFYWQWFHYARQSWGISRAYRAKDGDAVYEDGWLDTAIFYALPVLGILYRSYQQPEKFLSFDLWTFPVPVELFFAASIVAMGLFVYWVVRRVLAWQSGRLAKAHTLYMLSHFAIFAVAYIAIEDVTYGWLAVNIWHNAQYILFVWLFNKRRFREGVEPEARFLSYISQPGRFWLYLTVCIGITIFVYVTVLGTLESLLFTGLAGTLVLYQIVNFHHYIVDSIIWKVRSKPMRETLDLSR